MPLFCVGYFTRFNVCHSFALVILRFMEFEVIYSVYHWLLWNEQYFIHVRTPVYNSGNRFIMFWQLVVGLGVLWLVSFIHSAYNLSGFVLSSWVFNRLLVDYSWFAYWYEKIYVLHYRSSATWLRLPLVFRLSFMSCFQ